LKALPNSKSAAPPPPGASSRALACANVATPAGTSPRTAADTAPRPAFRQSGHYALQGKLPVIETRRIANNCADVGFCRINGAVQCKQHKCCACQRSNAASGCS
jgi:hypothetical protein